MAPALVISFTLVVSLLATPGVAMAPQEGADTFRTPEGCWQRLPLERVEHSQPLPVGALVPCPGVRPGARVWTEKGGCTLNFVFRGTSYDEEGNPVDEGLFIGMAGHCILTEDGEHVWAEGQGPAASDAAEARFGEVAYAVMFGASANQDNLDFALIRVDDGRESEVKPGLCHFGGPTGMSDTWQEGDVVHHFGQGLAYENTVQGRSGVVTSGEQVDSSALTFAGSALFGDSGSSLIEADGDAVGVVVAILPPLVFATPIAIQVDRAEEKLGMELDLVEAALT